jgi:hypothetical protein
MSGRVLGCGGGASFSVCTGGPALDLGWLHLAPLLATLPCCPLPSMASMVTQSSCGLGQPPDRDSQIGTPVSSEGGEPTYAS